MSKIPKTREEAFKILDDLMTEEERIKMASCSEDELDDYHFSLGLWIRNNWIYEHADKVLPLFDDEEADGNLFHFSVGADMESSRIIEKYWEYLKTN